MSFNSSRLAATLAVAVLAFGIGSAQANPWSGTIPIANFSAGHQGTWRAARWCASMTGDGHNRYLTVHVQYQKKRELLCSKTRAKETEDGDAQDSSCDWAPAGVPAEFHVINSGKLDNNGDPADWHTTIRYNGIPIRYHATNGWAQTQRADGIYTFSTGSNGISGVLNTNTSTLSSLTINKPGKLASYSATITAQRCAGWTP